MRIKIGHRLFIGFLLTALAVLAVSSGLTRWNFQRGFLNYVNESESTRLEYLSLTVTRAYGEAESWEPLRGDADRWLGLMGPPASETTSEPSERPPMSGPSGRPAGWLGRSRGNSAVSEDPLAISPRVAVLDETGERLFGPPPSSTPVLVQPITYRGKTVGSLHLNPLDALATELDLRFAEQQTRWIYGTSLIALLLAGVLAMTFTRQIVTPVTELTRGTRALKEGRFAERITVKQTGELGDLARDFNSLAETLQKNQHSQRQWIADISHELRTPLSILRGELHAVEDGVRELNESTRKSLGSEVERLSKLVNDLYQLSISDVGALRYQMEKADVVDILRQTVQEFAARIDTANLELEVNYSSTPLLAVIDAVRLSQLFTNVLENSVRYTERGGVIRVSCTRSDADVLISFEDSAPSVSEECLPKLFDRLFRVETSRQRSTGGAGLGLAICKNIVDAHGGKISATRSELGGLNIQIRLPATA